MTNPYAILGLTVDADDQAIRAKYLQLTREFPPEEHPEKSASIRKAYDQLKDLEARVKFRLFQNGADESVDSIIEDLSCQTTRKRVTLDELLRTAATSAR